MSATSEQDALTLAAALEIVRAATKDQTAFELLPLGREAKAYLRVKRKRLADASFREWESVLDKLARYFPALELEDFELPVGAARLEEFMDAQWGERAPRTYNKALVIVGDFFEWQVKQQRMHSDPTTLIERAKVREVDRNVFTEDEVHAILAAAQTWRDRVVLRLFLHYGLRQGAVRAVQIKHFDYGRKRLTVFTKGGKVRRLPIPHPTFWTDLERYILEAGAEPNHFLLPRREGNRHAVREIPLEPVSNRWIHKWWYDILADAGVVPRGTSSGKKMHMARHTSGQRILDQTGNLKAAQKLLMHASIQTTADIYTDWDDDQLAASLLLSIPEDENES